MLLEWANDLLGEVWSWWVTKWMGDISSAFMTTRAPAVLKKHPVRRIFQLAINSVQLIKFESQAMNWQTPGHPWRLEDWGRSNTTTTATSRVEGTDKSLNSKHFCSGSNTYQVETIIVSTGSIFLAVQDSSIDDLVTHSVSHSGHFWFDDNVNDNETLVDTSSH